MSHPFVGRRGCGWPLLFAQGRERLAHDFGLGQSALPRDSLKEGSSLRIDSDIQSAHGRKCITACNTNHLGERRVSLSTSASSSADNFQLPALTFCVTCSGPVAPAITLETCACDASHPTASSSMLCSRSRANFSSFSSIAKFSSVSACCASRWTSESRVPFGGSAPRLYFPVRNP